MGHHGGFHQVMLTDQHEESQDEEKSIEDEPVFMLKLKKRKRLSLNRLRELKANLREEKSSSKPKSKKNENRIRWSTERYRAAEQSMWQVLKDEGATFDNPITRHELRLAARKHIGDTGLLDHLLKHIEGEVAPCGTERFRRWFNTNGIMEYWLEDAELDKLRKEAGVNDPYWMPPSGSTPSHDTVSVSAGDLKMLQIEMAQMKKDMQELIVKKKKKSEMSLMEEKQKGFLKWKAVTEKRVTEIMTSLKDLQGMHNDMFIWKSKVEQRLLHITNKLSNVQKTREQSQQTMLGPPSVRWEDYLENSNLDNVHGNELAPWFGSSEMFNISQQFVLPDPNLNLPIQPLNGELINMHSGMLESAPQNLKEDQPIMTTDSSTTVNSKSVIDNSLIKFQEMFAELFTWKDKMEQQLMEVTDTVYGMMRMK